MLAGLLALCLIGALIWAVPVWRGPAQADLPPRDRALAPRDLPTDRPLRIVAFGTSLTVRGSWVDDLGARLGTCLSHSVEVTRVALSGAGVQWAEEAAQIEAVAAAAPDLILFEFAINDADLYDGVGRADSDRRTRAVLERITEVVPGAAIVELTMSPAQGLSALQRPGLVRRYDDVVARAEARGSGLVDLYRRWIRLPRADRGLYDNLHPHHDLVPLMVVPPLAAYVAAAFGGTCPESPDRP